MGAAVPGARKQVPRTIVTAAWAHEAEADDELTFAAGDRFLVLDRGDDQGWVYAQRLRRKDEANSSSTLERQQMRGRIPTKHLEALLAAWDWDALAEDELSFQAGDKLIVLDRADDVGWLYAELQPTKSDLSTKRGLVPTAHLLLLEQDDGDAFEDVGDCEDEEEGEGDDEADDGKKRKRGAEEEGEEAKGGDGEEEGEGVEGGDKRKRRRQTPPLKSNASNADATSASGAYVPPRLLASANGTTGSAGQNQQGADDEQDTKEDEPMEVADEGAARPNKRSKTARTAQSLSPQPNRLGVRMGGGWFEYTGWVCVCVCVRACVLCSVASR
jgi:hypothetical protein